MKIDTGYIGGLGVLSVETLYRSCVVHDVGMWECCGMSTFQDSKKRKNTKREGKGNEK